MAQMPALRTIANGTPADATDPQYNFGTIEAHLAAEVINRDGLVAMTAPLVLLAEDPTDDNHAVRKSYVDAQVAARLPVGLMGMWGTNTPPSGWLICDGTAVSRTTYADLFALYGTVYGTGNGTTTFNLPDFRGKVPTGRDASDTSFNALGETGGSKDAIVVSHHHTGPSHTHTINHTHTASSAGAGSHSHIVTAGATDFVGVLDGTTVYSSSVSPGASIDRAIFLQNPDTYVNAGGAGTDTESNHTHTITVNTVSASSGSGGTGNTGDTGVTGVGANLIPYRVINFIVKT